MKQGFRGEQSEEGRGGEVRNVEKEEDGGKWERNGYRKEGVGNARGRVGG